MGRMAIELVLRRWPTPLFSPCLEEKTHHSHDRIFRHAMSLPLVARQFLETWMPKEFLALVEWSTLCVEKISGISEALAERREDLLYRIDVAGKPVCFYIL